GIVARVARARDDPVLADLVEEKQHLDVREVRDALEGIAVESVGEDDAGFLAAPEVVLGVRAHAPDEPDRPHRGVQNPFQGHFLPWSYRPSVQRVATAVAPPRPTSAARSVPESPSSPEGSGRAASRRSRAIRKSGNVTLIATRNPKSTYSQTQRIPSRRA